MSSRRLDSLATRLALVALALAALLAVLAPIARGGSSSGLRDAASSGTANESSTAESAAPSLPEVSLPSRADVMRWLHDPFHIAIVVGVAVFLLLLLGSLVARYRPVRASARPAADPARDPRRPGATGRALTVGALAALVLFAGVAALAWTRDESTTRSVAAGYVETGSFAYAATAPVGAAYPTGAVVTGDPIFRRLVDRVRFDFDYRLVSANPTKVRGAIGLDLVLSDPQTGWARTLVLARPTPFVGEQASTTGVVDLARITKMQQAYRSSTGAPVPTAVVAVVPRIDVSGYSGDTVIDGGFAPELRLGLDRVALVPVGGSTALTPRVEGVRPVELPVRLELLGHGLDVSEARSASLLGLVTSLVVLLAGLLLLAARRPGERERIAARFGERIVTAREAPPEGRWVTELASIDELIRIAETYDRVVVRVEQVGVDTYYVDDGVALYRFAHAPTAPGASAEIVAVGG